MSAFVTRPSHIHTADLGTLTALIDTRTGRVETLLGWTHHAWRALARTGDPAAVGETLDSAQVVELVRRLVADGLLELAPQPQPWSDVTVTATQSSWGTHEVPASTALPERAGIKETILAGAAVAAVLLVRATAPRRRSFSRIIRLIDTSTRRATRAADVAHVAEALHWVRNVALIMPFRVACLEETAAAMLVLALSGRRAGWCHGIAADPIRLHAWITVDGQPVAEPDSTSRYTPLLRVPDSRAETDKDTTR